MNTVGRRGRLRPVLTMVGYGLYLAYFPIGPIGTLFLKQMTLGWDHVLLSRVLFELATVAGIFAWRRRSKASPVRRIALTRASFLAALAATAVAGTLPCPAFIYWAAMGLITATPKLCWYETLHSIYRSQGRSKLLVCLGGCFFVAAAVIPVSLLMTGITQSTAAVAAMVALSWACLELSSRSTSTTDSCTARNTYSSSAYMKVVTAGFGVSWALSYTVAAGAGFGNSAHDATSSGVMLAGVLLCTAVMLLFSRCASVEELRFTQMLRWAIVAVAVCWAAMPLVSHLAPALACFLCSVAYIFQSALMILLIVEVCSDFRIPVASVTASHYGRFIVGASVASLLYWAISTHASPETTLETVSALGVAAVVACVPGLPSRKSPASVLTMATLPEEQTKADLMKASLETLCLTRSLTSREREVVEMLVEGASRTEMAEALGVSAWTVKNHVASIYTKTGAHSARELAELLESGPSH